MTQFVHSSLGSLLNSHFKNNLKISFSLARMMKHTFNPRPQKAEEGDLKVQGQRGLQSRKVELNWETLTWKIQNKTKERERPNKKQNFIFPDSFPLLFYCFILSNHWDRFSDSNFTFFYIFLLSLKLAFKQLWSLLLPPSLCFHKDICMICTLQGIQLCSK